MFFELIFCTSANRVSADLCRPARTTGTRTFSVDILSTFWYICVICEALAVFVANAEFISGVPNDLRRPFLQRESRKCFSIRQRQRFGLWHAGAGRTSGAHPLQR